MSQRDEEFRGNVDGFLLAIALNFLAVIIYFLLGAISSALPLSNSARKLFGDTLIYLFFGMGLSQLIYQIPLVLWLKRRRRTAMMRGVIMGVAITGLLCGGCFVYFFVKF